MIVTPDPDSLKPAIQALPPTTVRQIGSSQVLVDPSSVVKELIDNALDARATAIFVDIAANTVDSIQVKDNGHGIPADDRALVCRRYCTSKIRDFHDLKDVGGKWLGFRGEAMASMAETSGSLSISTRVEGEPVALLLKYGTNGEVVSTERASHPVGTTVKVTDFFKSLPVRKQAALKHPAKWLAKIKRMMQAYALARPAVRFSLRVLKAKTANGNFVYAPKAGANVEDAAFKVVGRDCASQCGWTAMECDGFTVHAFLPKPDADGAKIANEGSFLSIDCRPVSSNRGTLKSIVTAFRERLRKANPALASVKEPFLCMNIICPPDSYDPNIEPAKDDVLFSDGEQVVSVVDKLLVTYYPEAVIAVRDKESVVSTSAQQPRGRTRQRSSSIVQTRFEVREDDIQQEMANELQATDQSSPSKETLQWRSNMYGIDEDDLELLTENQMPLLNDEEELRQAAKAANPWTIAKMNAPAKKKRTANSQLMTPAKGPGDVLSSSSPTAPVIAPRVVPTVEPLTPQTALRMDITRSRTDDEIQQSIQRLPTPPRRGLDQDELRGQTVDEEVAFIQNRRQFSAPLSEVSSPGTMRAFSPVRGPRPTMPPEVSASGSLPAAAIEPAGTPLHLVPSKPSAPRRNQRRIPAYNNNPFSTPKKNTGGDHDWMENTVPRRSNAAPRRQAPARSQNRGPPFATRDSFARPNNLVLDAAEHLIENALHSENNTDIRDFFRAKLDGAPPQHRRSNSASLNRASPLPSFTPVNPTANRDRVQRHQRPRSTPPSRTSPFPSSPPANPSSQNITDQLRFHSAQDSTPAPPPTPTSSRPQPRRRRSTLPHLRTKSSQLPLNHIPWEYRIQDVILPLTLPLSPSRASPMPAITDVMRKLNMGTGVNSLEWGYPAPAERAGVFGLGVEEGRVRMWCELLGRWYETQQEGDIAGVVMEGVWGALSRRMREGHMDMDMDGGIADNEMLMV